MTETIYGRRLHGFPEETINEQAYTTRIEYKGILEDLRSASPNLGATWGGYFGRVTVADLKPIENTDYGHLTVVVELKLGGGGEGGGGTGTQVDETITTEIEWVTVSRPMYEHPAFRVGGGGAYALTSEDIAAIKSWQKNPNVDYSKIFVYRKDGDYEKGVSSSDPTLSTNAKMFARGIQLGIESYDDRAPVAKWSASFVGGPPPAGACGQKENPEGVPGIPPGYEWVRDSDRGIKQGGQSFWRRELCWVGCKTVLVDVDEIFWPAP